jgi:hypothetical protein
LPRPLIMQTPWRAIETLLRLGSLVLCLLALASTQCAPDPRSVACTSDVDCKEQDPKLNYCVDSYCVECVSNYTAAKASAATAGTAPSARRKRLELGGAMAALLQNLVHVEDVGGDADVHHR